jgi:molybdopterin synthase catalytic subunit
MSSTHTSPDTPSHASTHASITRDAIDVNALLASVSAPSCGAISLFLGTVRDENDDRAVSGMRYDAYEAMAQQVLQEIVDEALRTMREGAIAAVHRIGELSIGDVSVAIATASPHRAPAYEASRYVIEEIKKRLPVWKHEHYVDGAAAWLDGVVPPMPPEPPVTS